MKSWIAAQLAAAIDGRLRWLSAFDVNAERVLYIEQDRGRNLRYQLDRIEIAERVPLGSDRLRIIPPPALRLDDLDTVAALEAIVLNFRPDVVIINALRDVLGGAHENSPTDIASLLRPLGRIAETYQLGLLVIDHFNKAGASGAVRGSDAHSGTAQKYNEADAVLIAERPRNELGKEIGGAVISVSKRRAGEPAASFEVTVDDTSDGGVEVRAKLNVPALSSRARKVRDGLGEGPATVKVLAERTGLSENDVHSGIAELRTAGLLQQKGYPGKAATYWLAGAGDHVRTYKGAHVVEPPSDAEDDPPDASNAGTSWSAQASCASPVTGTPSFGRGTTTGGPSCRRHDDDDVLGAPHP